MLRYIFAILLTILPMSVVGQDYTKFTEAEVKKNAQKFINTVFGEKPPTLADRLYFEGGAGSLELDETHLMYGICSSELKISDPENSTECFDKVVTPRLDKPKLFESLYYKLLRQKLAMRAEELKIYSIVFIEGIKEKTSGYYQVTVIDESPNRHPSDHLGARKQLLLRHIASPVQVSEAGTVSILSVVMPIHRYLEN